MHTFHGSKAIICYNSDMSGDCVITDDNGQSVEVPCEDILRFVGEHIKSNMISAIEQMDDLDVLRF